MDKIIKVLMDKLKLNVKEYDSISEDVKTLYKNIKGIYILYSDITGEIYIGQSKNISKRLEQHFNNNNFMVKDLMSKKPKIYIIPLNNIDVELLEALECYLIQLFNYYIDKDFNLKLNNIEYNLKSSLYKKYINEGRIKIKNSWVINNFDFISKMCVDHNIFNILDSLLNDKVLQKEEKELQYKINNMIRVKNKTARNKIKNTHLKEFEDCKGKALSDTIKTKYKDWEQLKNIKYKNRLDYKNFKIDNKIVDDIASKKIILGVWETGSNILKICTLNQTKEIFNISSSTLSYNMSKYRNNIYYEFDFMGHIFKESICNINVLDYDFYFTYRGLNIFRISLEDYNKLIEAV